MLTLQGAAAGRSSSWAMALLRSILFLSLAPTLTPAQNQNSTNPTTNSTAQTPILVSNGTTTTTLPDLLAIAPVTGDLVYVGILHSLTGPLASFEWPLIQAELLAIDEINANGGVLGKKIVPIIRDGASNLNTFVQEATNLANNASIKAVFGCGSSACRIAVKPVFEASAVTFWYPLQNEGQECSKNIMYIGGSPNQNLEPSIRFLLNNFPKIPVIIVGANDAYSRGLAEDAREMLSSMGRVVIYEAYIPVSPVTGTITPAEAATTDKVLDALMSAIKSGMPVAGVILNTLTGDANIDLFNKLAANGLLNPQRYPVLSMMLSEIDVVRGGITKFVGHFSAANYFMTDPSANPTTETELLSLRFITNYRKRTLNATAVVTDAMESAYVAVNMWQVASERSLTIEPQGVKAGSYGAVYDAPGGAIAMYVNNHMSKFSKVGRVAATGRYELVFGTGQNLDAQAWNQFVPATRGFMCDFRIAGGDKFTPPSIRAVLLYSSLLPATYDAQGVALYVVNTVNGGINGRIIVPTVICLDWPQDKVTGLLQNASLTAGIDVVFGTAMSATTWNTFNTAWSSLTANNETLSNVLIFTLPPYMPTCNKNIIFSGFAPAVSAPVALKYFQSRMISSTFSIGEESDPGSAGLSDLIPTTLTAGLPNATFTGACQIRANETLLTSACFSQLDAFINSTPSSSRPLIVNSIPPYSANFKPLYDKTASWMSKRSQKITIMSTFAIDEGSLYDNMTGHYAISTYFADILTADNLIFKQTIWSRAGPKTTISEAVEKAYTTMAVIFYNAALKAGSIDSESVHISMTDNPTVPSMIFNTVNPNNQISAVVRMGQVMNVAGKFKYRLVVGDSPATRYITGPGKGTGITEGETCYFGPRTEIPSSFDGLRIAAIVIAGLGILFNLMAIVWVIINRNFLIIRHSGAHFLILILVGCVINLVYVFIIVPVEKSEALCVAEFWPLHSGFIIVFAGLLQKVYTIFQSTQRKKFLKSQANAHHTFWIQVSIVCFIFVLYMILRTLFQGKELYTYASVVTPGVLTRLTFYCKPGIWEWSILGVELLMVIIGIAMALQIRNVPSAFNESFHLGMAIYIWAFIKILNEVFLLFLPFNYQIAFGLKAFGEIIPSLHTGSMFLWPKYQMIAAGKGNEIPRRFTETMSDAESALSRVQTSTTVKKSVVNRAQSIKAFETTEESPNTTSPPPLPEAQPFIPRNSVESNPTPTGTLTKKPLGRTVSIRAPNGGASGTSDSS
ncbi:hypothetical protein HDU97_006708 [Phlyctochytrium planicorne]|nr:hypothetical protein HDU97_006708 [Phlyctochytrium planicorne]